MAKTIGCTWFLQNPQGQFLMMQRDNKPEIPYPNRWVFPGGTVEGKETVRQASIRELEEELGYKPKAIQKIFTLCYPHDVAKEHFFLIRIDREIEELKLGEGQKIQFFDLDEIEKLNLAFWHREMIPILKKYLNEKSKKDAKLLANIESVRLYSNGTSEDREAYALLSAANVPFTPFGPTSETETPYIEYGSWIFPGLDDIKEFIKKWNAGVLPEQLA